MAFSAGCCLWTKAITVGRRELMYLKVLNTTHSNNINSLYNNTSLQYIRKQIYPLHLLDIINLCRNIKHSTLWMISTISTPHSSTWRKSEVLPNYRTSSKFNIRYRDTIRLPKNYRNISRLPKICRLPRISRLLVDYSITRVLFPAAPLGHGSRLCIKRKERQHLN